MNAVEIEQAISELAEKPFDAASFPFEFLRAFGYKETQIRRLQAGDTNKSDVGGVLHAKYIHLAVAPLNEVGKTLARLRESPATAKHKARFILATDGVQFEAEDLTGGDPVVCEYAKFPDHFGFFLPLAGITTVKQIRENSFDIRATSRLNRLYVQLLKDNPDWGTDARRPDMNHFMARLIFCFFAEDTDIFPPSSRFTATVEQMSARDSSNTHEVVQTLFLAMNTKSADRDAAGLPRWAMGFPYVNGGLFSGSLDVPRFSKIARSYLLHIGNLDWKQINPDIFGSMIQAVAEDEERGELGMHYTSVPNILKVLNPLFLDELRAKLQEAGDNKVKLLNLRKRIARIRVFDPACGSGNFLVIAYKEVRAIEAEINRRRDEVGRKSDIPLTNFRGIEIRDFAAEIARLALIIAEYQCDVLYRGPKLALAEFLPLEAENWITCGNALRIEWLSVCPPTGYAARMTSDDLFATPSNQPEVDFENEGGEVYVCGNPPYLGGKAQSASHKSELAHVFGTRTRIGELDYVTGWILRGAELVAREAAEVAFVVTNSVNQGAQVHQLWPRIFGSGVEIAFANKDIRWSNNAAHKAAVICSIVGLRRKSKKSKVLIEGELRRVVSCIGPYLTTGNEVVVEQSLVQLSGLTPMLTGNSPYDAGNLILSREEMLALVHSAPDAKGLLKRLFGSHDYLNGEQRWAIWIDDRNSDHAMKISEIAARVQRVREFRENGGDVARGIADRPHRFRYTHVAKSHVIIAPRHSSERREYIPFGLLDGTCVIADSAQAVYDPPLWHLSVLLSALHMAWIRAVAGKIGTSLRYSSALCYNTFPVPTLTEKNTNDLRRCAEEILLAREAHFPETIAYIYDPERMPADLRAAHDRNDEVLERIYIGRRFRNDTERLEKLFEMYTRITTAKPPAPKTKSMRQEH